MSETTCPDDADLLALADGDEVLDAVAAHLAHCPECRGRLDRLRGEVSSLRILRPRAAPAAGPAGFPSFIGKYFIAGVAAEEAGMVSLRGVHSVVGQEVTILLGRSPVPTDGASRRCV